MCVCVCVCVCVCDCEGDSTQFSNYGQQIFTATPVTSRSLLRTRPSNWISLSPFFFVVVYNHISLFLFSPLLWKRFFHPFSCNSVRFINKQLQVRIFNTLTLIVEVVLLKPAIKVTGLNIVQDSPVCVLRFYCLRVNKRHGSAAFHSCSSQLSHSV